ncbi:hypothetical protein B0H14DRAFT_3556327 [Mycena olivaceomarginata]|nr:hypothetical protein B0H14DRAFT_3556327 [Mycena olivaceomarginata]
MSSPQVTSSKPDLTGTHVAPEVVLRAGGNVGLAPEWQRGLPLKIESTSANELFVQCLAFTNASTARRQTSTASSSTFYRGAPSIPSPPSELTPPPGSRSETHQARDARNYRQPSPLYRTRPPPSMCGTNTMLRARNTVISAVPASRDRDCTRVYRIPRNLKLVVNAKEINPDESPFPIGSPAP